MAEVAKETKDVKISEIMFTSTGKCPAEATYYITILELKQYIANTATGLLGTKIKDSDVYFVAVKDVTRTKYNPETKRNEYACILSWQVALPANYDLYQGGEEIQMIGRRVGELSQNVVTFIKKFTNLKPNRYTDALISDRGIRYIALDMDALFGEYFDVSGYYYNKRFGVNAAQTSIFVDPHYKNSIYNKRTGTLDFGNNTSMYGDQFIDFFTVKKTTNTRKDSPIGGVTKAEKIRPRH